ncbi:MAG: hypothetical protein ABW220_02400 [Burkholderiaceae bacterium]
MRDIVCSLKSGADDGAAQGDWIVAETGRGKCEGEDQAEAEAVLV